MMTTSMTAPDAARLMLKPEPAGASRLRPEASDAQAAFEVVTPYFAGLAQERFLVLLLDAKNRVISVVRVAEGGIRDCTIDQKLVFAAALVGGAASIIVSHNHPSGDSMPSADDLALTTTLIEAGKLLRLPVLDHIIVGDDCFTSLRAQAPRLFGRGR